MNELTIGDKVYISSKRAAEITGYAKDYIGQLCREGRVEATLVGRNWYVLETSIRAHRFGEDRPAEPAKSEPLPTWDPPKYMSEDVPSMPVLGRKGINLLESEQELAVEEPPAPVVEPVASSVEDMQSAWREWFATRQQPLSSSNEVSEPEKSATLADEEETLEVEEAEPVTLNRVEEVLTAEESSPYVDDPVPFTKEVVEEEVQIHRTQSPVPTNAPELRIIGDSRRPSPAQRSPAATMSQVRGRRQSKAGKGSLALKTAFIAVAALACVITFVGSGLADLYVRNASIEASLVRFFAGTSVID